ncbi:LEAF RUST 10 DISEASE-RESISTANCE LOCUS RECEPTOR-LIKE PROTEIN KINASE-like 1.1 [Cajanus cajan]|uniref:LEAF RUST 10 DISEASE-RESISTANCE LOCUS RECEPTOR-LIKE PROTEIN KINASE-like 1.1 n=1 Tax=Cajanus cajan TaxID=3821 RepID=UPI00098D8C6A|nr:LEAF RUST 10 DISEASE-RESISTANCE LOCUS RECEPTOR-LIKE PROTEIN KINASE-like 1.1 [Cajanus cajan]
MCGVNEVLLICCLWVVIVLGGNANGHEHEYDDCPESFDCGSLGKISFPFSSVERQKCGVLAIHGCSDVKQSVQLKNGGKHFKVTRVNSYSQWRRTSISMIDEDFLKLVQNDSCEALSYNISVPPSSPLGYFDVKNNVTVFECSKQKKVKDTDNFIKYTTCSSDFYFASSYSPHPSLRSLNSSCSIFQLPVIQDSQFNKNPFGFLTAEITFDFHFSLACDQCRTNQGGHCRSDSKGNIYCTRRRKGRVSTTRKLGLMLGIGVGPWIIFGLILTLRHYKRKYGSERVQLQLSNTSADPYPNRDTESDRIFFGVPVFSYKELQEATNNFDHTRKLGDGGFGTVYYGTLRDGREVAIKHLFEHNYRRVEQFMNEIEILTRLRHRNLVSLYGCTSRHGHELLLVYEYIPNGTVGSHVHGDLARVGLLTWSIRMQIAIETATALAYLHASNIIHRDVKTNNILLDINFSVKVADFGLSRLLPNDVSHVSTAPQGSPGYLDPEYFQCYRLTDKSDVYSFGVVLMELISSMPAVDAARERDEVNLTNLAMKKIRKGKLGELVDPSLGFESDQQVRRMMTSVAELAFRCVQGHVVLRPSMDEVLETLKIIQSGKYDSQPAHQQKQGDGGFIFSTSTSIEEVHASVGIFNDQKLADSPNSFTQNRESESNTPNVSG